jgi:lysophospholipase L1-like esterase
MKKTVLAICSTLVIVVVSLGLVLSAEIAFRIFGPGASRGQIIDVELFPYKNYTVSSAPRSVALGVDDHVVGAYFGHSDCDAPGGVTARFNSDGFRSPEFRNLPAKQPDEIRIAIVGGSASISWNIGEMCTLDSNLRALFEQRWPGRRVRVFNIGSGAWKSMQELIAFQLHGLALNLDILVVFNGFNDFQHAMAMSYELPYSGGMMQLAYERYRAWIYGGLRDLANAFKLPYYAADLLAKRSVGLRDTVASAAEAPAIAVAAEPGKLATRVTLPLDHDAIANRTDFDPWNRETVHFYLRNMRSIAKIAEGAGVETIFALQPALYFKWPMESVDRRVFDSFATSANFVAQAYLRARPELAKIAATTPGTHFLDLSAPFNDVPGNFFGDNVHFNIAGYKIVADRIFEVLIPIIEVRTKAN